MTALRERDLKCLLSFETFDWWGALLDTMLLLSQGRSLLFFGGSLCFHSRRPPSSVASLPWLTSGSKPKQAARVPMDDRERTQHYYPAQRVTRLLPSFERAFSSRTLYTPKPHHSGGRLSLSRAFAELSGRRMSLFLHSSCTLKVGAFDC